MVLAILSEYNDMGDFEVPLKVFPTVQNYSWGRSGADSVVAELVGRSDETDPFAELWFGAHPKSPSTVSFRGERVALDELIHEYPEEILGAEVSETFGGELPFLFKVLSIRTALSIQAHPDKERAARLHERDPGNYPDGNHKPEIAIAVSDLESLYGFRPRNEIERFIERVPEFAELVGEVSGTDREFLEQVFAKVLTADEDRVTELSKKLWERLEQADEITPEEQWAVKLREEYPDGDPGLFCFFIMNVVHIPPGSAIFNEPNVPHAYLSGEIIECMACSDNVVRAALTPKFKDTDVLLEMLGYEDSGISTFEPTQSADRPEAASYDLSVEEFRVERFRDSFTSELQTGQKPELLFCLEGTCRLHVGSSSLQLSRGDAYLIPAAVEQYQLTGTEAKLFRVTVP